MKLSYPSTTDTPFTDAALTLKIARHTPCSACDTCSGLRPPPGSEVVLGDDDGHKSSLGDLNQYGSDEEDEPAYLDNCICGHDVGDHGANEAVIGREEFSRRGRLAVRLDEVLQVGNHLTPAHVWFMLTRGFTFLRGRKQTSCLTSNTRTMKSFL
ncbi:hypothetical protein BS17DRAFT_735616 [Gyrodon lividus]|nr:hypothetical protein BS17DRAFT_735616 [Gyrodon lividus]